MSEKNTIDRFISRVRAGEVTADHAEEVAARLVEEAASRGILVQFSAALTARKIREAIP